AVEHDLAGRDGAGQIEHFREALGQAIAEAAFQPQLALVAVGERPGAVPFDLGRPAGAAGRVARRRGQHRSQVARHLCHGSAPTRQPACNSPESRFVAAIAGYRIPSMPRSLWNGTISFGMVRVPVKLYTAVSSRRISLRE